MAGYELGQNYKHWQDDGCEISPKCTACPLEVCKYDTPATTGGDTRTEDTKRARLDLYTEIMNRRSAGKTYEQIAAELRVSRRAIVEASRCLPLASDMQLGLWRDS